MPKEDILHRIQEWSDCHREVTLKVTSAMRLDETSSLPRTPWIRIAMRKRYGERVVTQTAIVYAGEYDTWSITNLDDMLKNLKRYERENWYECI